MSLHLNKLPLSVKSATNPINAEWESDCKPPSPPCCTFSSSLISSCNLLCPSLSFQHSVSPLPLSLSECLIIFFCLCWAWRGVFFLLEAPLRLLALLPGWVVGYVLHVWPIYIDQDLSAFQNYHQCVCHWVLQSVASCCKSHEIVNSKRPQTTPQISVITIT